MNYWILLKLKFGNESTRRDAAEELGRSADPRAVIPLITSLRDNYDVNRMAKWALIKIGKPAANALIDVLKSELKDKNREYVQGCVAEILGQIGDTSAVDTLITTLHTTDSSTVREEVVKALGKIGDKKAIEPLILQLKTKELDVCFEAALALESLKWEPVQNVDKAWFYVVLKRFEEAKKMGALAVEPLLLTLRSRQEVYWAEEALKTLTTILEKSIKEIKTESLHEITRLYIRSFSEVNYDGPFGGWTEEPDAYIDCTYIQQLATLELLERDAI